MWNWKIACSVTGVVVVATVFVFANRPFTAPANTTAVLTSTQRLASAVGVEVENRDAGNSTASCQAPFVYMPENRHRVEAPSAGSVARNTRALFEEMSAKILARWGAEYEDKLFSGDGMAWADGGKVVEDKMLNAVLEQDIFVAAFTGNSIAAAHDCLYEQSYPVLLNVTMGRLMAAAGVGYNAINVAMGNTRATPYSYCVDAHAGFDADIVSWSFGMEIATEPCAKAAAAVELFIRSSLVLPRRPAVLVLDAQPDQGTKASLDLINTRNSRYLGYCKNQRRDLMKVYRDFGIHSMFASSLVLKHTAGDQRFSHEVLYNTGKHYPRPMRWHPAPAGHELVADMLFMHYGKLFLNAIDRLEKVAPGLTAVQLREKKKKGPQQRPLENDGGDRYDGHDVLSMTALREAVGLGRDNPSVFSNHQKEDEDEHGEGGSLSGERSPPGCFYMGGGRGRGVLPKAEWCSGWHCELAGNYRCANTYYPLEGNQGSRLLDMVVVSSSEGDEEGDGRGGVSENPAGLINRNGKQLKASPTNGHWAITLNEVSRPAIEYLKIGRAPDGFHKPIDIKWVLVGDADSGPIEFEFFTADFQGRKIAAAGEANGAPLALEAEAAVGMGGLDSRVVVCKPDFIDRVHFADSEGVRFSVDGVETSVVPAKDDYLLTRSCALLAANITAGRHRLKVEPLRRGEPFVAISHIIYPA